MRPIVFVLGWLLLIIMLPLFRFLDLLAWLRHPYETEVAPKAVLFDQNACPQCGVIGHHCPNFVPPPEDKGCPGCADCGKTHPKWPDYCHPCAGPMLPW